MGRGGNTFLEHWHRRALQLTDRDSLQWVVIDDPAHGAPHAECFRLVSVDGVARGVHATEALRLLTEHGHADAAHVRVETHVGQPFTH